MNNKKLWNGRSSKNGASALPTCEKLLAETTGHSSQSPEHIVKIVGGQEEAARAYDVAAIKHFGEFARLNFPLSHSAYQYSPTVTPTSSKGYVAKFTEAA